MATEVDNTTPERQAYLSTLQDPKLKGRFGINTENVRLFKSNPYIRDLPEAEVNELNKKLLTPFHGELFHDDDRYIWNVYIKQNELTGKEEYIYVSHERELAEKLKAFENTGVQNQLMSAYNNGRIYTLYVDRGNLMMYPNSTLVFPADYAFYTVRRQQLNKNKEFVYVAGTIEDGDIADTHIAMKKQIDSATNTEYTRMTPASVFEIQNAPAATRYDQIISGEFYVVEFYNERGFMVDAKLFQAQDSVVTNTALPSASVQSIRVSVIRAGLAQTSTSGVYPILAGEDIVNGISYSIRAVYNDGTIKDISNKLDTPWLARTWTGNQEPDTTSAVVGDQFKCEFVYYPNLDEEKGYIGTPVRAEIIFQVVENQSDKVNRIIPVVWRADNSNYGGDGVSRSKIYNLKIYKMSSDGVVSNCTRSFRDTFMYVDNTDGKLKEFDGICPFSYDPYNQCLTFVWNKQVESTTYTFDFGLWSSGVQAHYRFSVAFGSEEADVSGNYVRTIAADKYGYEPNGPMADLKNTYAITTNNGGTEVLEQTVSASIMNGAWHFVMKSHTGDPFSNRYSRNINGTIKKANSVQLFAVKDETYTPLSRIQPFSSADTTINIASINNETTVTSIIESLRTFDWVLAKFYNTEVGSGDVLLNFDVFCVRKTV